MPYTPPTHRSPASSAPSSPDASRRPSLATGGARPTLPRSSSYLTKHRRTPSAGSQNGGSPFQPTPEATSEDLKSMMTSLSVRKSPPPVTDERGMPNGAIISPPESSASSDDDDLPEVRSRRLDSIKQLHAAASQIPQHRESSPTSTRTAAPVGAVAPKLEIPSPPCNISEAPMHHSFSTGSISELATSGRRISHTRSATDSDIVISKSADTSLTGSDADSEEEMMMKKPQMVRKKSGELVRPALRPASRRRPSSMPGTPTFSKAVHFDSHLEHVRHFLQVDRPLAVSAGSSPADNYSSDTEYPFLQGEDTATRTPPFEWEITVTNFPVETPVRKNLPVRLERVWLSNDQKCLIGSVAVANLAFQKLVICRFTLDYWKTTSEVAAEYSAEIRPKEGPMTYDRFNFTIKLSEVANLESKTLYFCIRYSVNGQELWDNNNGTNFQVDFRKKMLPQNGKRGFQGAAARRPGELPRSNRRPNASSAPRPKSMPVGTSEFGELGNSTLKFDQSIHEFLGETGPTALRLKGVKSTTSLPSDNLDARLGAPSGQAFANRYDFGASLSTAIQAAKNGSPKMGAPANDGGLYMKPNSKQAAPAPAPVSRSKGPAAAKAPAATSTTGNVANTAKSISRDPSTTNQPSATANPAHTSNTTASGPSSMSSASYEELVSKYCFFGSKQSSPQLKDGTMRSGRFDGPNDDLIAQSSTNSSADSSLTGSPLQMGGGRNYSSQSGQQHQLQHIQGAQHHSVKKDPNPYFQHALLSGFAPSPGSPRSPRSPLQNPMEQQRANIPPPTAPSMPAPTAHQATGRSPSPTVVGPFHHSMGGASSNDFQYPQRMHRGRFMFHGAETHSSPAIRG